MFSKYREITWLPHWESTRQRLDKNKEQDTQHFCVGTKYQANRIQRNIYTNCGRTHLIVDRARSRRERSWNGQCQPATVTQIHPKAHTSSTSHHHLTRLRFACTIFNIFNYSSCDVELLWNWMGHLFGRLTRLRVHTEERLPRANV